MKEVRVALVGYGFIGRCHTVAYRQVPFYYPDIEARPVMTVLCDANEAQLEAAKEQPSWQEYETDYERVLARDDIDLIDLCVPNNVHVPMAIQAAEAGKHVISEKPLALSLAEARQALAAVRKAGVIHMICHNYRRVPAIALAKQMIEEGTLGTIYHWRATYLQDWLLDPTAPLVWRCKKEIAGSGAMGDLMAHSIDLALWLVGDIERVVCDMETFVKQRPLLSASGTDVGLGTQAAEEQMGDVTVDDGAIALARFANGTMGTFEATRFAPGRRNFNVFEINGSKGSVRFNLERMNELEYYNVDDPGGRQGFEAILVTEPCHPHMGLADGMFRFWPPGHIIGYEHSFINTMAAMVNGIATGENPRPSFEDAVKVQAVLEACEQAAQSKAWVEVEKG